VIPWYPIQPSVITVAPGSTCRVRKGCSEPAEASGRISIRQRPYPRGCLTSTATPTSSFLPLARPPRSPSSSPPMKVSSTSTLPDSRSRPGRTSTDRSRCSIAHAVGYEPISSERCRPSAETPSLAVANIQQAVNHTVSGVRLRSNSVPAVTDVRLPQAAHLYRPSATTQPPRPHFGQAKPPGHRSQSR